MRGFELPPDKPLTLAAYVAGPEKVAYVENVAVGDQLVDMPLFVTPDLYVPCPLEASYQDSWRLFPSALKGPLVRPAGTGPTPATSGLSFHFFIAEVTKISRSNVSAFLQARSRVTSWLV